MRHHNEGYSIADDSPLLPRRYLSRPGYSSGWWYLGLCLGLALGYITQVHLVVGGWWYLGFYLVTRLQLNYGVGDFWESKRRSDL
jgi:hypothetical protein